MSSYDLEHYVGWFLLGLGVLSAVLLGIGAALNPPKELS